MAEEKRAPCNITGVIGASQTGKGVYCHARLARPHSGITLVWSPLEHPAGNDRYAEVLKCGKVSSIPALVDAIKSGARAVVFVPVQELRPDGRPEARPYDRQFDRFCRVAAALRSCRVLVEELSRVTLASWAPASWKNLSTAGAHAGLELIGTAQRPAQIDKDFLGNCTEIRCYRVNSGNDARTMQDSMGVPWSELMDLPTLHYWHRWKHPAPRNEQGVQALPGQRAPRNTPRERKPAAPEHRQFSAGRTPDRQGEGRITPVGPRLQKKSRRVRG